MIRCSEAAAGEPLHGTAPERRFWWAIDHPGPWPAQPIVESVLGDLASWVMPLAKRADTTVVLIRQRDPGAPRQVYLADTHGGTLSVGPSGPSLPPLEACSDTLTLVCTHGRRDQCCAVLGRPLVDVVEGGRESSHIGGHRFAPTVLLLPSGIVLGRCTAQEWPRVGLLDTAALPYYRGRTALNAPAQVVDAEARRIWRIGLTESISVTRDMTSEHMRFHASHDGENLVVDVEATDVPYIPSCDKPEDTTTVWRVIGRG